MKKYLIFIPSVLGLIFLPAVSAKAVCPICTIAVASGLGVSRWLGIDDSISGLWIGGLTVSMIFWTINYFNKKKWNFKAKELITSVSYYLLIVLPLYYSNLFSGSLNIFSPSADKLFLGIIAGSATFWAGTEISDDMKRRNNGKARFPFQKVAMPLIPLLVISLALYFTSK